jgi:hypothetical protein
MCFTKTMMLEGCLVAQHPPPWLPLLLKVCVGLSCPSRVSRTNLAQATTTNDGARARMAFSKIEVRLTGETVNSTRAARSAMIDAGLAGWMISRVKSNKKHQFVGHRFCLGSDMSRASIRQLLLAGRHLTL